MIISCKKFAAIGLLILSITVSASLSAGASSEPSAVPFPSATFVPNQNIPVTREAKASVRVVGFWRDSRVPEALPGSHQEVEVCRFDAAAVVVDSRAQGETRGSVVYPLLGICPLTGLNRKEFRLSVFGGLWLATSSRHSGSTAEEIKAFEANVSLEEKIASGSWIGFKSEWSSHVSRDVLAKEGLLSLTLYDHLRLSPYDGLAIHVVLKD
jgi:hypothetical protein